MFGRKIKNKIKEKINKKIIVIAILLLVAGVTYVAAASGVILLGGNNTGLVLDLDLSQGNYNSGTKTLTDHSGGGNNGVSANAATFTNDNNGRSNGAMNFDAPGDYVRMLNNSSLNTGDYFTFEGWYKYDDLTFRNDIYYYNRANQSVSTGFHIMWLSGHSKMGFQYANGTSVVSKYSNSLGWETNRWYHVAFVQNNITKTISFYRDGVNVGVTSYTDNALIVTTGNAYLGAYQGGGRFKGSISSVHIYNKALSASEIQILYNSSKSKIAGSSLQSGLVGYWPLDGDSYDAAANKVTDKTPYGNNGTNYGATLTTDRNGQANGAMSFDGTSNYINAGNNVILKSSQGSLSFWIKPIDFTTGRGVFHVYQVATADYLRSYIYPGGIIDLVIEDDNLTKVNLRSTIELQANIFTHVLWVQDGVGVKLYLNGVNTPITGTNSGSWWTNHLTSFTTIIGYAWAVFKGSISDVRVYNRALSATEAEMLYDSYKPKIAIGDSLQQGLVLDMPLTSSFVKNETVGSEIMTDRTPYSNDGQNYGATVGADFTSFSGVGNYINAGHSANLDLGTNDFSFVVWAKADSGLSGKGVINKGGWGSRGFAISEAYSPANRYYFVINDGGYKSIGLPLYEVWDWKQIIGIKTTNHFEAWVNGVKVGQWNGTLGSLSNPAKNFEIGRSFNPSYFNGSISGVKVYNRALTPAEIATLYGRGR